MYIYFCHEEVLTIHEKIKIQVQYVGTKETSYMYVQLHIIVNIANGFYSSEQ